MNKGKKADMILNLSGLSCPNPSLITAKRLEKMDSGETLEVLCRDKSVKVSIQALCRQGNYELIETREEKGLLHFFIKK